MVFHYHHGHRAPAIGFEPFAHLLCIIAGCVDDIVACNVALFTVNNPCAIVVLCDTSDRTEPDDFRAHFARAFGQGLGQLRRVYIPIRWIPKRPCHVMGFKKGVFFLGFFGGQDLHIDALIAPHGTGALEFLHPFLGMGDPNGSRLMIIHRVIDFVPQPRIKLG